jgi:hypothetical protein
MTTNGGRQSVDIYGNPVDLTPTGRRIVGNDGKLRAQMRRGDFTMWGHARPHEDSASCAVPEAHDGCPTSDTLRLSQEQEKKT